MHTYPTYLHKPCGLANLAAMAHKEVGWHLGPWLGLKPKDGSADLGPWLMALARVPGLARDPGSPRPWPQLLIMLLTLHTLLT